MDTALGLSDRLDWNDEATCLASEEEVRLGRRLQTSEIQNK